MESQALEGDERDVAFGEAKPRLKEASPGVNSAAPGERPDSPNEYRRSPSETSSFDRTPIAERTSKGE
jgi:hypothetical protein